jgi:hypothetical protein
MHLFELVDSSPYTVTTDDATNFLEQLERIGRAMNCIGVWIRSLLAPRVCHHLSGTYRCIRDGAV